MSKNEKKKQTEEEEGPRSFGVFLNALDDGDAEKALSVELQDLGKKLRQLAIATSGKVKGSLTLKLGFSVEATGPVAVAYDVTVKAPKLKNPASHWWLSKGGNMLAENPKQQSLFGVREVPGRQAAQEIGDDDEDMAEAREV